MHELFSFKTLKVVVIPRIRTIKIELLENEINFEMVFELEKLIHFLCEHIEINVVLLTTSNKNFIQGINYDALLKLNDHHVMSFKQNFYKMLYMLFHIPQILIMDLKQGVAREGIEITLAADIRISNINFQIDFDYLKRGIFPHPVCVTMFNNFLPPLLNKNLFLLNDKQNLHGTLKSSGFIYEFYKTSEEESLLNAIFEKINELAPIARIQNKQNFLLSIAHLLPQLIDEASLKNSPFNQYHNDWREYFEAKAKKCQPKFMSAKELKQLLKQPENSSRN